MNSRNQSCFMRAGNPVWDRTSSKQREKLFGAFRPILIATCYRGMAHDDSSWKNFLWPFITQTCRAQSGSLRSHTPVGNLAIGSGASELGHGDRHILPFAIKCLSPLTPRAPRDAGFAIPPGGAGVLACIFGPSPGNTEFEEGGAWEEGEEWEA